ncbi:hypothetical protein DM01DRAFT_303139 [Hesseltinella vesiculosa]|uniref:Uncharacterized protein n=1 Tax=Hesseltinella vesiculosa TaxID=101127 RepID=A0A1X2G6S4_9FUNG|nr:hypothetical protein DM01DRAFT_303139 [Hesseltinella vesiculosa]
MDSVYTYVHWEKSNLPVLADDWIGSKLSDESITVPDKVKPPPQDEDDDDVVLHHPKILWQPNPMDD